MKILLVEDDLEISKLLAEFLQKNGYEVFCQYDGFMYWIACGKIIST